MTPAISALVANLAVESRPLGLLAVFLGGLALNLTPCVYPMIPVTMAYFSHQASPRRALAMALLYVTGLSLSYACLGLLTAWAGGIFGAWLQHPAVLIIIAGMIVALAFSMFGAYELQVPAPVLKRLGHAPAGAFGAFLMGASVGLVAAPCVGPFIASLVLYVTKAGDPVRGFALFFALGLGMGLPYVALALAVVKTHHLPKSGPWLIWTKKALGCVLLGLAVYFLHPILPERVTGWLVLALLVGAGIFLGWLERTHSRSPRFTWGRRVVGASLLVAAAVLGWPRPAEVSLGWQPYSAAALAAARSAARPVVVDVAAEWCLPCAELDHMTFHYPQVIEAMQRLTALRLDATGDLTPEGQAFIDAHQIVGVPSVLFFDAAGQERRDLRLEGFEGPEGFLRRLKQLQAGVAPAK